MTGKPELTRPRASTFQIRTLRAEVDAWTKAARSAGKSASAWAREVLNAAAGRVNVPRKRGEEK